MKPPRPIRRLTVRCLRIGNVGMGLFLGTALLQLSAAEARWRLEFISDLNIPTGTPYERVGQSGQADFQPDPEQDNSRDGVLSRKASGAFGGISGIAYDPQSATLLALSDSSTPILFPFELKLESNRLQLRPSAPIRLRGTDGVLFPAWQLDPEGIAIQPGGGLWISSEGYVEAIPPVLPAILEFGADGVMRRSLSLPEPFLPADLPDSPLRGVRGNRGFESLTFTPEGRVLFTATEGPLHQDDSGCGLTQQPCVVRLLELQKDGEHFLPPREYRVGLDPIAPPADYRSPDGGVGLSDLLALNESELLAIERGFVRDRETDRVQNRILIYHLDLQRNDDRPRSDEALSNGTVRLVPKTLVLDLDAIVDRLEAGYQRLDNMEAICFGPTLPDGDRTVLIASDNNFSNWQRTVFLLFRLVRQ